MKVWALVPVKRFDAAKSRLSGVLDAGARAALARSLFERVLEVLSRCPALTGIAVVTDSAEVACLVEARGLLALRDPAAAGTLAETVDDCLGELARRGADAALVLMSDLPDVTPSDVERLVGELAHFEVVVVCDARGEHTNALGVRLGSHLPTHFGAKDSFRLHRAAAERARLPVATPSCPTIAFDVDTPEDHAEWTAREGPAASITRGGSAPRDA